MKKISLLILLSFSLLTVSAQLEGTWKLAPQAGALAVGPAIGDYSWWSNADTDVTTRACLFDDQFVFNADGTFMNVQDGSTWLETWQGVMAEECGTPVAPHDGSNAATFSYDDVAGTVTLTGVGAHLGLPKAINGEELSNTGNPAPASITYMVGLSGDGNTMTVEINAGAAWKFILEKEVPPPAATLAGTWKLAPVAGALAVGPAIGDYSWWSNADTDVATRACLFDDQFVFNADGTFMNVQDGSTWLETWQGVMAEECGTPVAPHDGSNAATWTYDDVAGTATLTGVGAHLGLPKAINGEEISNTGNPAPASITYLVGLSADGNTMTVEINAGAAWKFILEKDAPPPPVADLTGDWVLSPIAGALAVGPAVGDYSWWSNADTDVTTRACLFDDVFAFNADGSFENKQDGSTWLETWQGVMAEECGTPVAPHDGSNAATWAYDDVTGMVTLTGVGAHLGLAKAVNGEELSNTGNPAPASITYIVGLSADGNTMTVEIDAGAGWKFILEKVAPPPPTVDLTGTWVLEPIAGALAVGPAIGDYSWWSNADTDVATRACLFDDKFVFNADGTFENVQDGSTWLETWQGVMAEECGAPVAPHDGSNAATWAYDDVAGTVTLTGVGAHIGLPKAINGEEISNTGNPAPASITYLVGVSTDGNNMTVEIDAGAAWRFLLVPFEDNPTPVDVTFSVDMSQYQGVFTGVTVAGSFNGWDATANPLTDVGNMVYELTLPLLPGAIEYKFTVDGGATWETPTSGAACTVDDGNGNINRIYNVATAASIGTVCWNSCEACGDPVLMDDVTFRVNMNEYTGSFTTVSVFGSFNGWDPTANPMTDADGDGKYDLTLNLAHGDVEYKFILDGGTGTEVAENFAGGEDCTVTNGGFTNRALTIDGPEDAGDVCWEACAVCTVNIEDQIGLEKFSVSPNPASDVLNIQVIFTDATAAQVSLVDVTGKEVYSRAMLDNNMDLDVSSFAAGLYFVVITTDKGTVSQKLIVK